ncbi:MAG: hypothetical protein WA477_15395 [Candidatus Sulfotelmatobacter sp.]
MKSRQRAVLNFLHGALQFLPLRVMPVMENGVADDVEAQEQFVGLLKTTKSRDIFVRPLKAQPASRRKTLSSHSTSMAIIPAAIKAIIQSPLRILNFLTAFFLPLPSE